MEDDQQRKEGKKHDMILCRSKRSGNYLADVKIPSTKHIFCYFVQKVLTEAMFLH